jgi:dynein heavy chain
MFIDEYPDALPCKALNYLTGECNYGGRVTEGMDRRLLATLLAFYYNNDAGDPGYELFANDTFKWTAPPDYVPAENADNEPRGDGEAQKSLAYDFHLEHIKTLPLVSPPGVFGFHENASLTKEMNETYNMCSELLLTAAQAGGGGGNTADAVVGTISKDVLDRVPKQWNIDKVQQKFPTLYTESMNTVLTQELTRFNGLIKAIYGSLQDIQKAVKGLVVMSAELEVCFSEIFDGKTPAMWLKASYPSLKPLGGYVNDLVERLVFFQNWVDNGTPINFWFSGIYFQQAFTTGTSQNYARTYKIPIDTLGYDFLYPKEQRATERPKDGVICYGIFFEAARWDWDTLNIEESEPKVLFPMVPTLHLVPCKKVEEKQFPAYECPCYKVSTRKGVLSTTGHSTNFVMIIKIPSSMPESHWIKRGTAMLTSLDT